MLHDYSCRKTGKGAKMASFLDQVSVDTPAHRRPRRTPWMYGVGAMLLFALFAFTPLIAQAQGTWTGWFRASAAGSAVPISTSPDVADYTSTTGTGCVPFCLAPVTRFLFARQSDSTIDVTESTDGGSWSPLAPLFGGGLTPNAPSAVQFGSTLDVFVQGDNSVVWVNKFNGTSWTGWRQITAGPTQALVPTSTTPDAVVYQNKLFLIMRESDGSVQFVTSSDGSNWSGLSSVPGGGVILSAPFAAQFNNTLFVFAQGLNNDVWFNTLNGTNWGTLWNEVLAAGTPIPTFASPTAAVADDDTLNLFALQSDETVLTSILPVGANWSSASPVPVGGLLLSAPFAIESSQGGPMSLFGQGLDSNVWVNSLIDAPPQ